MGYMVASEVVVGVGDCGIAGPAYGSLTTYALGSCIALVAWDWKAKVGGLLHAMLPESAMDPARAAAEPFVFVDTGTAELLRRIEARGGSRRSTRCCLAGGASMILDPARFEIGKRNYLAVKKACWKQGVFIDREDVGGTETRSLRLDVATGRIDMQKGVSPGRIFVQGGIGLIGKEKNDPSIAR